MATSNDDARVESLSAITLATRDMARAVSFYEALGFRIVHGGANEAFTSFALGSSFLNITTETHGPIQWWGRIIIYVPTSTRSIARRKRTVSSRSSRHATRLGTSATFISPILTVTNSASRVHFEERALSAIRMTVRAHTCASSSMTIRQRPAHVAISPKHACDVDSRRRVQVLCHERGALRRGLFNRSLKRRASSADIQP